MKDRIYQLMKYQGMSQKEFAATLCIAEGTLSGIFTGRTNWLMFGEGEMLLDDASSQMQEAAPAQADLFASGATPSFDVVSPSSPVPQVHEVVKYIDKPQRKITEIRVFYDDGTFETFSS